MKINFFKATTGTPLLRKQTRDVEPEIQARFRGKICPVYLDERFFLALLVSKHNIMLLLHFKVWPVFAAALSYWK